MKVEIEKIKVRKRVRKDLGDIEALASSIKRNGLLNPVTITSDYVLVAGERRLRAVQFLEWNFIDAIVVTEADTAKLFEMELEENTFRLPFADEELIKGYQDLNRLKNPNIFQQIWMVISNFFDKLFSKK